VISPQKCACGAVILDGRPDVMIGKSLHLAAFCLKTVQR
jgi:hypothetical protein